MNKRALLKLPLTKMMDLKIDYAFKQLFGNEKNKKITVVFLNAILKRTGRDVITDISFQNIEIGGEYEEDKQSRLDLLVKTKANEWINVEIQFTNQYDMVKRSIYYWSKVYSQSMSKGKAYKQLNPVIAINIMNFDLFDQTEQFHTTYHLYEDTEKILLTDVMEFHFIEIPKLLKDWKTQKLDPWNDVLARWLLLLGIVNHRKEKEIYEDIYHELEAIAMKDEQLFDALTGWKELSLTEEQYFAYEGRLKRILDEEAAIAEAKLRELEAREEGREEGITNTLKKIALQLLKKQFGLLPSEVEQQIRQLNNEKLEQLVEKCAEFNSLDEVEQYLQAK
ncbi:Rpn family recombination-promoting nuclease/putative transposase [Metasolibacillus fluoroglycofenilyticus]|uniref:Rpn family recombination-promoting nuclease/putative transposase n=1 Tax=Metasolibacillus fluoroglycofenilyticus TaxID=1239396 RepID=UPI001379B482|nr:Rpn family recombination-promoting nuclease/putative transposase [Metasolibacillus fluoroglycofenilyticus]